MEHFNVIGYVLFAVVTSITPGPNNIMLFNQGRTLGIGGSVLLMLGIFLGFSTLLYITGYGIGEMVMGNKAIALSLKIIGSAWLAYMAVAILRSGTNVKGFEETRIGFVKGYFMQFVNPKAWIMAVSGAGAFMPHEGNIHMNVFYFTILFGAVGIPSMVVWVLMGDIISRSLKSAMVHKFINIFLFLMMMMSVAFIWV